MLYVLCRTDALFPPKIAPDVIKALTAAGVEARYFELDSDLGHSSSGPEHANGHRCCAGSWRRCSPGSTNALRQCSLALRLEDGDVDLARGQEHAAALKQ